MHTVSCQSEVESRSQVELWYTRPNDWLTSDNFEHACQSVLSESEMLRIAKMKKAVRRHLEQVTRFFVRKVLSEYAPLDASEWQFSTLAGGKPIITNPMQSLYFNLSHTQDIIVCAISENRAVGVDIEFLDKPRQFMPIAKNYFAKEEVEKLQNLNFTEQKEYFYRLWTLKEAYLKAQGLGITVALDNIYFDIDDLGNILLEDRSRNKCRNEHKWSFELAMPSTQHIMAVCVELEQSQKLNVKYHSVSPARFGIRS